MRYRHAPSRIQECLDVLYRLALSAWGASLCGSVMNLTLTDALGCIAATLVLATFSVRRMYALRCLGLLSNVAFIAYAIRAELLPVLMLHIALLPLNTVRLFDAIRSRPVKAGFESPKLNCRCEQIDRDSPPRGSKGAMRRPLPLLRRRPVRRRAVPQSRPNPLCIERPLD